MYLRLFTVLPLCRRAPWQSRPTLSTIIPLKKLWWLSPPLPNGHVRLPSFQSTAHPPPFTGTSWIHYKPAFNVVPHVHCESFFATGPPSPCPDTKSYRLSWCGVGMISVCEDASFQASPPLFFPQVCYQCLSCTIYTPPFRPTLSIF